MKKIYYICIVALSSFLLVACVKEYLDSSQAKETNDYLTIEQAKAFFENNATQSVGRSTGSNDKPRGLTPGDFTPNWGVSKTSQNDKIASVDIPINSQYRYKAIRCEMQNGKAIAYEVEVTQKLVIVQGKEKNLLSQYILTLIPDKDYYSKNKHNISSHYLNAGSKCGFSGIAVYSEVHTGITLRVNKFKDGQKISNVVIPAKSKKQWMHNAKIAKNIIGDISIGVRSVVSRSMGETDGDYYLDHPEGGDDWHWDGSDHVVFDPIICVPEDTTNDADSGSSGSGGASDGTDNDWSGGGGYGDGWYVDGGYGDGGEGDGGYGDGGYGDGGEGGDGGRGGGGGSGVIPPLPPMTPTPQTEAPNAVKIFKLKSNVTIEQWRYLERLVNKLREDCFNRYILNMVSNINLTIGTSPISGLNGQYNPANTMNLYNLYAQNGYTTFLHELFHAAQNSYYGGIGQYEHDYGHTNVEYEAYVFVSMYESRNFGYVTTNVVYGDKNREEYNKDAIMLAQYGSYGVNTNYLDTMFYRYSSNFATSHINTPLSKLDPNMKFNFIKNIKDDSGC